MKGMRLRSDFIGRILPEVGRRYREALKKADDPFSIIDQQEWITLQIAYDIGLEEGKRIAEGE